MQIYFTTKKEKKKKQQFKCIKILAILEILKNPIIKKKTEINARS